MSTVPTPEVKPFEMTLGDGSVVKAANMEEAFKVLAKMKEDTSAALKAEKERNTNLQSERDNYMQELSRRPEPVKDDGKGFSKERYYQVLNEDPIAAQNYIDQYRFGIPDPVGAFNQMRQSVDAMQQQAVAAAFTAIHAEDFPATPEAAKALTSRTQQLVEGGFPYSLDTVNYAYTQLVGEGSIKPLDKTTKPDDAPNPSLTGTSGAQLSDTEMTRIDQMTDADLAKYMRSKGMAV